jgi:catechol 2,3-dioxygenase-like lactoylglutathione lyase family enzyme
VTAAQAHALFDGLGRPVQIAYAVPDAVAAAHRWAAEFGAGPFFVRRHIPIASVVHRGEVATFDHTSAYGQWGDVMVELVEDHTEGPSVVNDLFPFGAWGLHHLAFFVPDVLAATASLNRRGWPTAMEAVTASGVRFHFIDSSATLGHMLELYERSEPLATFYERVAFAAEGWDGTDPVRIDVAPSAPPSR